MFWEYFILAAILAWAVYYVWKALLRKKGCSCESCPTATRQDCAQQTLVDLRQGEDKGKGKT